MFSRALLSKSKNELSQGAPDEGIDIESRINRGIIATVIVRGSLYLQ